MDKIDLKGVNIRIMNGNLNFPDAIGTWRPEATLDGADIELELDVDQLETEYLQGILVERGLFVAKEEPTLEKYSDKQIEREAEYRGFYVSNYDPDEITPDIRDFTVDELRDELKRRAKAEFITEDLGWYLRSGNFEEFLIYLERSDPVQFSGASKLKLSK